MPEGPAQFADALDQRIVCDGDIRPDRGKEFVLRNKPAAVFHEVVQHREGLWPEGNLVPVNEEAAAI